jgi:transposase-like protein
LGRRRSRSEAERLVLEFEQSGMTRGAFCKAHEVTAHTLDYYRRKLRSRGEGAPQLLPVELVGTCVRGSSHGVSPGGLVRVELANGRRIVVEEGFSASLLKSVVAALEA